MSPAPARKTGQNPMYQLQTSKNSCNFLKNSSVQEEKSGKNIYLNQYHWDKISEIAEERGVSRNQAFRDILDEFLGVE
jgi:predicted DNA-binding ribbon-helix-helix protein